MKILVTGGAGYIGTELVVALAQMEEVSEVVIYDNLSRENYHSFLGLKFTNHQKIKFINGDVLDSRGLVKALDGVDVVYHLAAKVTTPFANTDPHYYEQVNHWGTAELVYAIEESRVKKLIYTSSIGVYGSTSQAVTEDTVPNPKTFYGISKMRGEEHIARLQNSIDTLIIRCGNVYGYSKSMRFDAVINKFAFEANFNKKISIHGNGKQTRAFIHIDVIKNALAQMAIHQHIPSGIYNLVERNMGVLDIVDTFKALIPELEFLFINQHLNLREIAVDTKLKLDQYISIDKKISFKEEIKEFLQHFSY